MLDASVESAIEIGHKLSLARQSIGRLEMIRAATERQRSAGHQQYFASFNLAYAEGLAAAGSIVARRLLTELG